MPKLRPLSHVLLVAALFAPLIIRCSLTPYSGGGTEGGNVSGILVDDDGPASAMVLVQLIPADYDPGAARHALPIISTTAAGDGSYSFKRVPKRNYSVQAVNSASGKRALITGIVMTDRDVSVPVDTLRVPGIIKLFLPGYADASTGHVYVPGTTIHAALSGTNGFAVLDSVPSGIIPSVSYASTNSSAPSVIRYTIIVASSDTAAVYNPSWKYARRLVLNTTPSGADMAGDVFGFPLLVRLNGNAFDFSGTKKSGADLRFTKENGIPLAFEIEQWDSAAGQAAVWVRTDTVYGNNSTQQVLMYWGNPEATDTSNGAAVFDTSNGFIGVWHMNEGPTPGTACIRDHTANSHDATPFGSMTAANSSGGTIGNAVAFNGKDDYVNAGNVSVPGNYSIGLWVLLNTVGDYERFIYKDSSYTLWYDKDSVSVRMEHFSAATWWKGLLQDGGTRVPMAAGTWDYLTATFDGTVIRLYKNGAEASVSNPIAVSPRTNTKPLVFGRSYTGPFVNGVMDEIRIEGTARSADWIKLCYMNQRVDDKLVIFK